MLGTLGQMRMLPLLVAGTRKAQGEKKARQTTLKLNIRERERQCAAGEAALAVKAEQISQKKRQYEDDFLLGEEKIAALKRASRSTMFAARVALKAADDVLWMTDLSGMEEDRKAYFMRGRAAATVHRNDWLLETEREEQEDREEEKAVNAAREAVQLAAAAAVEKAVQQAREREEVRAAIEGQVVRREIPSSSKSLK